MSRIQFATTHGAIVIELDQARAPKTSENILNYVRSNHYDGTIFHRVIDDFMVQGGGYDQQLTKRKTQSPVENEAHNGLKNLRGTVALARTQDIHSGTCQFFINVVDNPFLDHRDQTAAGYGYAVFAHVCEGMKVVDTIRKVETGASGPFSKDCPLTAVVIETAVEI